MEATSGKTISGKPSQRTKKGQLQIEQAKDPAQLKKKQAMMAAFVRPRSKSPPPDPIPEVPEKPVVKKKRGRGKDKKQRKKRGDDPMHNIAPDKGFAAEGSYWGKSARPGDESSDPGDLEILPKRQAPVASLPGVSQKQQRKDKKQEDRRAKLAKSPEEIQDNIAKLLAATDAIVEHTEEREAIVSVQRSENDQLEERSREIGMDETEELAVNAAIIRAQEQQRQERNALVAQERELEGNIQMSTDLIRDTRARASALGSSSRELPKLTKKIETWERHRKEYEEDLQKLRERGQPQAQLIITDPNAADETFDELLRQIASEELPPVPAIPEPERGGPASEQASEPTEEKAVEAEPELKLGTPLSTPEKAPPPDVRRAVVQPEAFYSDFPAVAQTRADILAVHGFEQ